MKSLQQIVEGLLDADYGNDDTQLIDHILYGFFDDKFKFYTYEYKKDSLEITMTEKARTLIDFNSLKMLSKIGIKSIEFRNCGQRRLRCLAGDVSDMHIKTDGNLEFRNSNVYQFKNVTIECPSLVIGDHFQASSVVKLTKCKIDCEILELPKLRVLKISDNCRIQSEQLFLARINDFFDSRCHELDIKCFGSGDEWQWKGYLGDQATEESLEAARKIDIWDALKLNKSAWPGLKRIIIGSIRDRGKGILLYHDGADSAISQPGKYKVTYKDNWHLRTLWELDSEMRYSYFKK